MCQRTFSHPSSFPRKLFFLILTSSWCLLILFPLLVPTNLKTLFLERSFLTILFTGFSLLSLSHVQLFVTPGTIQSMECSRPEFWRGQPFPSPGNLPSPGIKPRSPALQADYLPVEPQGKPKNTRVGSLSLLQWIFLTQELNRGLLHCRWILYQLSYSMNLTPYPILCFFIDWLLKCEIHVTRDFVSFTAVTLAFRSVPDTYLLLSSH